MFDKETGETKWMDTSSSAVRRSYAEWWNRHEEYLHHLFIRSGVDAAKIRTDQDYVKPLVGLFKKREARF
jgi:hypothetical protein